MDFLDQVKQLFGIKTKQLDKSATPVDPATAIVEEKKPAADEQMLRQILESIQLITKDVSEKIRGAENRMTAMEAKLKDDSGYKQLDERVKKLETQLDQFTKVYELITSQYSPFIGDNPKAPIKTKVDVATDKTAAAQDGTAQAAGASQPNIQSQMPNSPVQVFIQTSPDGSLNQNYMRQPQGAQSTQYASGKLPHDALAMQSLKPVNSEISAEGVQSQTPVSSESAPNSTTSSDLSIDSSLLSSSSKTAAKESKSATKPISKIPQQIVPSEHAFVTYSNHTICSVPQLLSALKEIDDEEFGEFVSSQKNDFASWVRDAIGDSDFAEKLSHHTTRQGLISYLETN
jgi:hypothetical protein